MASAGIVLNLIGIVLIIIGLARSLKGNKSGDPRSDPGRVSQEIGLTENAVPFAGPVEREQPAGVQQDRVLPEQEVRQRQSRRSACPECGVKYGLFERLSQPTMCSGCWKRSHGRPMR